MDENIRNQIPQIPQLPQLPQNIINTLDHDLLIRVDQQMKQLSLDIKDVKDNTLGKLAVIESKIVVYDQILAEYSPTKNISILMNHDLWINNFKITWKVMLFFAAGISGIITFTGTIVLLALNILKFK